MIFELTGSLQLRAFFEKTFSQQSVFNFLIGMKVKKDSSNFKRILLLEYYYELSA